MTPDLHDSKRYPLRVVTEWQDAFDGGYRVPSMVNTWDTMAYWFSMLRDWDDDTDWEQDWTARN